MIRFQYVFGSIFGFRGHFSLVRANTKPDPKFISVTRSGAKISVSVRSIWVGTDRISIGSVHITFPTFEAAYIRSIQAY